VIELGKSEIVPHKEGSKSVVTKLDLTFGLPGDIVELLRSYNCDLATWEEIMFVLDQELWKTDIVLTREEDEGTVHGKILTIETPDRFKLRSFSRDEFVS